jgi:hypothetical protein
MRSSGSTKEESKHQIESHGSSIVDNFSLVIGGPFYNALRRMKLVEPAPNIGGRIAALVITTWCHSPASPLCKERYSDTK